MKVIRLGVGPRTKQEVLRAVNNDPEVVDVYVIGVTDRDQFKFFASGVLNSMATAAILFLRLATQDAFDSKVDPSEKSD